MAQSSLVIWLALILSTACLGGLVWTLDYHFVIEASRIEGEGKPLVIEPRSKDGPTIKACDERTCISIEVKRGNFRIVLQNLSSLPLEPLWSLSGFKQEHLGAQRLLANPSQSMDPLLPAMVSGRSEVEVSVLPRGKLEGVLGRGRSPIDGRRLIESTREEILAIGRATVGDSFEIHLALRWSGTVRIYLFRFTASDFKPRLISWA